MQSKKAHLVEAAVDLDWMEVMEDAVAADFYFSASIGMVWLDALLLRNRLHAG